MLYFNTNVGATLVCLNWTEQDNAGKRAVVGPERPFGWLLAYDFFRFVR